MPMEMFDLTPTERQTVVLLARGRETKEIAIDLSLSKSRIYSIISEWKIRLGTKTTAGIVARAIARGIIDLDAIDECSEH